MARKKKGRKKVKQTTKLVREIVSKIQSDVPLTAHEEVYLMRHRADAMKAVGWMVARDIAKGANNDDKTV